MSMWAIFCQLLQLASLIIIITSLYSAFSRVKVLKDIYTNKLFDPPMLCTPLQPKAHLTIAQACARYIPYFGMCKHKYIQYEVPVSGQLMLAGLYASMLLSVNVVLSFVMGAEELDVAVAIASVGISTPLALVGTGYITSVYLKSFNATSKEKERSPVKFDVQSVMEKRQLTPPNVSYVERSTILEDRMVVSADVRPYEGSYIHTFAAPNSKRTGRAESLLSAQQNEEPTYRKTSGYSYEILVLAITASVFVLLFWTMGAGGEDSEGIYAAAVMQWMLGMPVDVVLRLVFSIVGARYFTVYSSIYKSADYDIAPKDLEYFKSPGFRAVPEEREQSSPEQRSAIGPGTPVEPADYFESQVVFTGEDVDEESPLKESPIPQLREFEPDVSFPEPVQAELPSLILASTKKSQLVEDKSFLAAYDSLLDDLHKVNCDDSEPDLEASGALADSTFEGIDEATTDENTVVESPREETEEAEVTIGQEIFVEEDSQDVSGLPSVPLAFESPERSEFPEEVAEPSPYPTPEPDEIIEESIPSPILSQEDEIIIEQSANAFLQHAATPTSISTNLDPQGMVRHASNITVPEPAAESSDGSSMPVMPQLQEFFTKREVPAEEQSEAQKSDRSEQQLFSKPTPPQGSAASLDIVTPKQKTFKVLRKPSPGGSVESSSRQKNRPNEFDLFKKPSPSGSVDSKGSRSYKFDRLKRKVEEIEKVQDDVTPLNSNNASAKRKKGKSKPPTYRRSEFSQATIDVYTQVPKLILERGRKMTLSKNASTRSVSGPAAETPQESDSRGNSHDSRENSQPHTTRTQQRGQTTEPKRSGSFSSRNTFFGMSKRSPNSFNTHKESPRGASPNSVQFPDPSAFLVKDPTAHVDWKKRGEAPILEDYIIEEDELQTSAQKRMMRDKSDKTKLKEKMTREQLIELARAKGYKILDGNVDALANKLESRRMFKRRHSRKDKYWQMIENAKKAKEEPKFASFDKQKPLSNLGESPGVLQEKN